MSGYNNLAPIRFSAISATTLTRGVNDAELGDVCIVNGKQYIYTYNDGPTISVYDIAVPATTNTSPYSVTVSSTTEVDYAVGICVNTAIATYHYGWLLKHGVTDCKNGMAGTAHVAGEFAIPSIDGGIAAYTATAKSIPNIVIVSAGASGGTGDSLTRVFIRA